MKMFKPLLTEDSQFFTTRSEVVNWCNKNGVFGARVNDDLTITLDRAFSVVAHKISEYGFKLPVKFKSTGNFVIETDKIQSLQGFPDKIFGYLGTAGTTSRIKTIEGLRTKIIKMDNLSGVYLDSFGVTLSNIHKHILESPRIIIPTTLGPGPILGLLLIKDLISVGYNGAFQKTEEAIEILKHHLSGDRDILDCQEELIKSGLKEYAKI